MYLAFCDAYRINPCKMPFGNGLHQLLGHPDAVQDADMEVECELVSHGIDPEAYWGPILLSILGVLEPVEHLQTLRVLRIWGSAFSSHLRRIFQGEL